VTRAISAVAELLVGQKTFMLIFIATAVSFVSVMELILVLVILKGVEYNFIGLALVKTVSVYGTCEPMFVHKFHEFLSTYSKVIR